MKDIRIYKLLVALFVVFGLASGQAQAAMMTYSLGTAFNGKVDPKSPLTPDGWLMAAFDDSGGSGSVILTLTSGLGAAGEFISQVDFSVHPAIDPSGLEIERTGGTSDGIVSRIIATDQNNQTAAGSHGYDVELQFKRASGNRFDGVGETVILTLSGSGLTAEDFDFWNAGTGDSAHVAAHIQGISTLWPDPEDSTWIKDPAPVPLPAAAWMLGPGLLGLAVIRRTDGLFKKQGH
ncbi:MAG: VPLPA-CTERM sorting domain-containing protein [Syntrophus sp. (in: bacteria)]|nr:VPLPA-CTERM sorting domain-containing protein [Syntrophus sp. (in: bacteria)]